MHSLMSALTGAFGFGFGFGAGGFGFGFSFSFGHDLSVQPPFGQILHL